MSGGQDPKTEREKIKMNITMEILNAKVDYLNAISGCIYGLYCAYGKVKLVKHEENGGINPVSEFGTKREIANIITAIERYAHFERMTK